MPWLSGFFKCGQLYIKYQKYLFQELSECLFRQPELNTHCELCKKNQGRLLTFFSLQQHAFKDYSLIRKNRKIQSKVIHKSFTHIPNNTYSQHKTNIFRLVQTSKDEPSALISIKMSPVPLISIKMNPVPLISIKMNPVH